MGRFSLLKKIKKIKKGNQAKPTLFVKNKRGQTKRLKINRKSVLSVLEDKRTQIERFVIENNLSYCRLADLKQIFEYYNQL